MAYYSEVISLNKMVDHIYGRTNIIKRNDRPNMFIKELNLYIEFLKDKIKETKDSITNKHEKYLLTFEQNLKDGISYYYKLFNDLTKVFENTKSTIIQDLESSKKTFQLLILEIENLTLSTSIAS